MLRIFKDELRNPKNFVVTLELVPGRESKGRNTDTLKGIAREAFADGRVSAVSITDNPGGISFPESGCAISSFKNTEAETHAQYRKLDKKPGQGPPEKK